jgi:hypothetical protein
MSSVKEFDPDRRSFLRKGVRYGIGTGLLAYGFTDAVVIGRKAGESPKKAKAKVEAQGVKAPDDETLRQANLKREPSGLVVVNSDQPVTQQERDAVAKQAVYDWSYKRAYNNDPEAPTAFRELAYIGAAVVGCMMDAPVGLYLMDTIQNKIANWAERRNAAKAQRKDK